MTQFYVTNFTGPSAPKDVTMCGLNTTQICISWNKPDGGNAIDNYTLTWRKQNDFKFLSHTTDHYKTTVAYSHRINELKPGQKVNFSIRANNVADKSEPAADIFAASKFMKNSKIYVK